MDLDIRKEKRKPFFYDLAQSLIRLNLSPQKLLWETLLFLFHLSAFSWITCSCHRISSFYFTGQAAVKCESKWASAHSFSFWFLFFFFCILWNSIGQFCYCWFGSVTCVIFVPIHLGFVPLYFKLFCWLSMVFKTLVDGSAGTGSII